MPLPRSFLTGRSLPSVAALREEAQLVNEYLRRASRGRWTHPTCRHLPMVLFSRAPVGVLCTRCLMEGTSAVAAVNVWLPICDGAGGSNEEVAAIPEH